MTLGLCKGNIEIYLHFEQQKGSEAKCSRASSLVTAMSLSVHPTLITDFFFSIYLYVKKKWDVNMFVLYLMNCVDKNNCVSPTVLGFVGQNNNYSFKRVVPPLFPCLCARFTELSKCSLSGQPLPAYQEWPWHLSHVLSGGALQCVCTPLDFYRQKTIMTKGDAFAFHHWGYMKSLCIKPCTRVNRDQSDSHIVIIMFKYQHVTT